MGAFSDRETKDRPEHCSSSRTFQYTSWYLSTHFFNEQYNHLLKWIPKGCLYFRCFLLLISQLCFVADLMPENKYHNTDKWQPRLVKHNLRRVRFLIFSSNCHRNRSKFDLLHLSLACSKIDTAGCSLAWTGGPDAKIWANGLDLADTNGVLHEYENNTDKTNKKNWATVCLNGKHSIR